MSRVSPLTILIVEDDADTRENLRDILELDGHAVEEAATAKEAMNREDWSKYATILLDRKLPDGTAAELLPRIRELAPEAELIIITGYADFDGAIQALRNGASDFLIKPINPDHLRSRLERIAEHRQLVEARKKSEHFARSVLDSLSSHIAVLDHSGTIIAVNQAWRDFAAANGAGTSLISEGANYLRACTRVKGVEAEDGRKFAYGIHHVLDGRIDSFEMEYPCHSPEEKRWFLGRVTPFQRGDSPQVVVSHTDITSRKLAEERAVHAERLAAIGQMVTGLAHESRNALQRGQACLEMLAMEVSDQPRSIDLIARLQKAQDDLARLYEDVRDYAAPVQLRSLWSNLAEVWRSAWNDLEPIRQGRNAVMKENIEISDLMILIDPFRLRQVFKNIMDNSLAATTDPVEISIGCHYAQRPGLHLIQISIRDNGPGLTPEQRPKVFEPFYTTKTKGTGLGLAICRGIMEAHGGRIELGADESPGTEFILTLPRQSV